ncbi:MFS general substrate transporter [Lophium mytilinum]|uniref:MFS general substrate transporter n=1 Tax=Lophium mytilinum TaxID=390894 RepID=A0A6A6QVN4_9PEZI|nr:MFS general substrate transporter [Lophium mytilinum]
MAESKDKEVSIQTEPVSAWWRKAVGLIWDSVEGDPRDRRYVQRLDTYLFSYICLGYFIKYLDQTNYTNAFVSGMKEDLKLYGNERNWLNTYFNIGIIIGTIPSQMIQLKYVRPSIWIPSCEIVWTALVMAMAGAKDVKTLYVLRFFVGLAEACSFPGYAALLGGWYGPTQLTKRVAIFEQTSAIASMFSGYLQAALYKGLNGRLGLAGWRWLFIFDGVISFPIAIWGIFAIPDLPHTTKAFYWSEDDKKYGVERIEKLGRKGPEKLTLRVIKGVYTNWRLWAFILPYLMVAQAGSGTNYFNLWLKAEKYSVVHINTLPTAGSAISVVAAFAFGIVADRTGHRWPAIVTIQVLVMISNILLSVWDISKGAKFFAFYLSYVGAAAQPIVIGWGHELSAGDPNLRQLLVATGNIFTYCFSSWLPLALFPTYDAPKYQYGYQILILFGGLAIIETLLLHFLHSRRPKAQETA